MAFNDLIRRLGNLENGCLASAGRGLGTRLRSVEDYVHEVINRGVCYVDNTIHDNEDDDDEEVMYQRSAERVRVRSTPNSSDNLLHDTDYDVISEHDTRLLRADIRHWEDGALRKRACDSNNVSSAEVWDVGANQNDVSSTSATSQYSSLLCAPMVESDTCSEDAYRLTDDFPTQVSMTSSVPTLVDTTSEDNENFLNEILNSQHCQQPGGEEASSAAVLSVGQLC